MYTAWIFCAIFNFFAQLCLIAILWSISHKIHFEEEPSHYSPCGSETWEKVNVDSMNTFPVLESEIISDSKMRVDSLRSDKTIEEGSDPDEEE